MREIFDDMMERRILGKLATIAVPILLTVCAWLGAQLWTARTVDDAAVNTATLAASAAATLTQANDYTDEQTEQLRDTMMWMATMMEVKWNVRRPENIRAQRNKR